MMMRHIVAILVLLFSSSIWAEGGKFENLVLAQPSIDASDVASIKRGAKFFATNCMTCHTLVYLRYDTLAQEAGITYEKMPLNVKAWPYGVTPPDLSLEASIRGAAWIYTYLHSFYQDTARPTGVNNLLLQNTAMPNIVGPYQGEQLLVVPTAEDLLHQNQWYDYLKLTKQGSMTADDFDSTIRDVANFLTYAAEPYKADQERIGYWVLGFLAVLFVLMFMLKKEYWKDVKKHKKN
jgi:ubiquinol-cytochrome c reductase cytochrome c1 subunit